MVIKYNNNQAELIHFKEQEKKKISSVPNVNEGFWKNVVRQDDIFNRMKEFANVSLCHSLFWFFSSRAVNQTALRQTDSF